MAQLNFHINFAGEVNQRWQASNGTLSFFPFSPSDSISFGTLNIAISKSTSAATFTFSIGLYSLTGSSLSLANSISETFSNTNNGQQWVSLTAVSATQNITPGSWWLGLLISTGGDSRIYINGQSLINAIGPENAFPGGFIGGRMTESTNALPSSYATSGLDITGGDATNVPIIILTA